MTPYSCASFHSRRNHRQSTPKESKVEVRDLRGILVRSSRAQSQAVGRSIYIANDESPSQHVTVGLAEARPNNEKRSAGTCWVSGVKLNHGSTSSRWRRLLAVETLAIDRWHDRTTGEDLRARSIARDRSHAIEVKHFRQTAAANRTCC